jgi:hypothetical protein
VAQAFQPVQKTLCFFELFLILLYFKIPVPKKGTYGNSFKSPPLTKGSLGGFKKSVNGKNFWQTLYISKTSWIRWAKKGKPRTLFPGFIPETAFVA